MTTLLEIEPEYREALEAAMLADFDAMLRAPAAGPPASKHAHRETVPLEIVVDDASRRFYLKRVFKVPPRHAIWPLFRFRRGISQPRHEWRILGELAECGIPAAKRVAYGERRVLGVPAQAFLLVEAVPMENTLEDWLCSGQSQRDTLSSGARKRLVHELGGLIARMHIACFRWPDIHVKHLFARLSCRKGGRTSWSFALIDVERMTKVEGRTGLELEEEGAPCDATALDDISNLEISILPRPIDKSEILIFCAGYTRELQKSGQTNKNLVPLKLAEALWLESSLAQPRLPDDHVNPRQTFLTHEEGIVAAQEPRELLGAAGIHGIDDVFNFSDGKSLSKPGLAAYRDRIRLTLRGADGKERTCYLKRYRKPPLAEQLRRMREQDRRDSSAKREAHFIKRLSLLGIPTMHCLAWGQEMAGPWERRSFLITEEIRGESLEKLAARAAADPSVAPSPRDRHEIIRQLALIARRLHPHRLFHRDLYLSHVFLTRNADGGIVLRLIDLARMIEKPLLHDRWMVKDLAALDYSSPAPLVTRADRMRFLYHYNSGTDRRPSRFKPWLRELARRVRNRAARMARHDARKVADG